MSARRWGVVLSLLTGVIVLPTPQVAGADVFRFEDQAGVVYYTNVPTDPRYRPFQESAAPAIRPASPAPSPADSRAEPVSWMARFGEAIRAAVERYRVDRRLVEAVITVESAGNPWAVSPKGAVGLMQLMPARAAELGVKNPLDPYQNIDGGVRHLRDLLERFTGNVTLALAAYNAGEMAVRAHGGVPPFPETREYVRKIGRIYSGPGLVEGAAAGPEGGLKPSVPPTPQIVYQETATDGTITFTNLPPRRQAPGGARPF